MPMKLSTVKPRIASILRSKDVLIYRILFSHKNIWNPRNLRFDWNIIKSGLWGKMYCTCFTQIATVAVSLKVAHLSWSLACSSQASPREIPFHFHCQEPGGDESGGWQRRGVLARSGPWGTCLLRGRVQLGPSRCVSCKSLTVRGIYSPDRPRSPLTEIINVGRTSEQQFQHAIYIYIYIYSTCI